MTDPDRWSAAEKEKRLQRLFEETQTIEDDPGFMEVAFEDDTRVYQYSPGCHNVTGMDEGVVTEMVDIIERHDLTIVDTGDSRTVLETIVSKVKRPFSREKLHSDTEWVTACHRNKVEPETAYTVFGDICRSVYGSDTSAVTEATIKLSHRDSEISWTDI